MVVGLLTVEMHVPGSHSLKDKRMVLRRVKDRLKKFNVSVAEVEAQDHRQLAVLGIAMVGNESRHVRSTLDQIVGALRGHPVAELLDCQREP